MEWEKRVAGPAAVQNLEDAGCSPELVDRYLALGEQGGREGQLSLLRRHRAALLEQLHLHQRRLDCLDYLIHQIQKESGTQPGK